MRSTELARPTVTSPANRPAAVRVAAAIVGKPVWVLVDAVLGWGERWRQRQALLRLDDHLLKDIGVSRSEAELEGQKPFWRG